MDIFLERFSIIGANQFGANQYRELKRDIPSSQASVLIDWLLNNPSSHMPDLPVVYSVDDKFPLDHGVKSLSILQDFLKLTEAEKLAIRWHMGATEPGTHFDYPAGYAFRAAMEKHPLVTLLFTADLEASQIMEKEKNGKN